LKYDIDSQTLDAYPSLNPAMHALDTPLSYQVLEWKHPVVTADKMA